MNWYELASAHHWILIEVILIKVKHNLNLHSDFHKVHWLVLIHLLFETTLPNKEITQQDMPFHKLIASAQTISEYYIIIPAMKRYTGATLDYTTSATEFFCF